MITYHLKLAFIWGIDENEAASDADSTQSRYDSRENLLDLDRQGTEATNALTHKDSSSSNHRWGDLSNYFATRWFKETKIPSENYALILHEIIPR